MESIKIGNNTYFLVVGGYQLGTNGGKIIFQPGNETFEQIERIMNNANNIQLLDDTGAVIESRTDLVYAGRLSKDTEYIISGELGAGVTTTVMIAEFREPDVRDQVKKLNLVTEINMRAASFVASTFTDEQALQVPELYDNWSGDSVEYRTGTRLNYNDILYKVLQNHTSQPTWTPDAAPSLYAKVLVVDPDIISEWQQPDSTNGYAKGDYVTHNGKTWESLVDNNTWEPGVMGTETIWREK